MAKRKTAWLLCAAMMIFGLLLGSYLSYRQMRTEAVNIFRAELEPVFNEQIQLLYNMLTIYNLNAPTPNDDTHAMVIWSIESVQSGMVNVRMGFCWNLEIVSRAHHLHSESEALQLSESDARFMRNLLIDIEELQMITRQSRYNALAAEFNVTTRQGLSFLTHNFVTDLFLRNYGQLPIFD